MFVILVISLVCLHAYILSGREMWGESSHIFLSLKKALELNNQYVEC
jgi:hypothetical protein